MFSRRVELELSRKRENIGLPGSERVRSAFRIRKSHQAKALSLDGFVSWKKCSILRLISAHPDT